MNDNPMCRDDYCYNLYSLKGLEPEGMRTQTNFFLDSSNKSNCFVQINKKVNKLHKKYGRCKSYI